MAVANDHPVVSHSDSKKNGIKKVCNWSRYEIFQDSSMQHYKYFTGPIISFEKHVNNSNDFKSFTSQTSASLG